MQADSPAYYHLFTDLAAGTLEHVTRMVPELQNALGAWSRVQLLQDVRQEPTEGSAPHDGERCGGHHVGHCFRVWCVGIPSAFILARLAAIFPG